jgi:hypothetical protein
MDEIEGDANTPPRMAPLERIIYVEKKTFVTV